MLPLLTRADGPPLDPTADEARRWVEQELAKAAYHPEPSLLERFVSWLLDHLPFGGSGFGSSALTVLLVLVVLALVAVLVRYLRSPTRRSAASPGPGAVLDDATRPAAAYRAEAHNALSSGRWDAAVIAAVRAIAVGSVERALLEEVPGRTAHELSRQLAPVFPDHRDQLSVVADLFDAVRYGHLPAAEAQARAAVALDTEIARTRPLHGALAGAS